MRAAKLIIALSLLLPLFTPLAAGQSANFIIILTEQPVHTLSPQVGEPYRQHLAYLRAQAQGATTRQQLAELQSEADSTLHQMRSAILEAAASDLARSQAPIVAALRAAGGELLYRYRVVNAIAARLTDDAVARLNAHPGVAAIHPDEKLSANLNISAGALSAQTWWNHGETGGIWDVAVVDSGIDRTHPAFAGHTIIEGRFLAAAGNPPTDPSPDDVNGHGSNVSGIVSSVDTAYRGIAYGHHILYNLKAGYDTDGADGGPANMYWSDAMAAVDWAFSHADSPDVFNLSYGSCATADDSPFSRFWDAVVDDLDTSVAISAGNNGLTCIHQPSIAYNVLSVANVDDQNTLYRYDDLIYWNSSRGPVPGGRRKPDIAAPGTAILSANNTWEEGDPLWDAYSGTSQAAPHVAGAMLLALDASLFSPVAQKALLINTAEDRGDFGWDVNWGWGYMDLAQAYNRIDDVFERTISPFPDYDLYVGAFSYGDRATLAWNRHVDYSGAVYPPITDTHNLNDLDLYLYNAANNLLMDASVSPLDNVEQVTAISSWVGVLRVQAVSPTFEGVTLERYALATGAGFAPASGPQMVTPVEGRFAGPIGGTIRVSLPVDNAGDLPLHAVSATTSLPAGVTLVGGTLPAALGSIPAGERATATWSFQITDGLTHTLVFEFSGTGYGLDHSAKTTAFLKELPIRAYLPLTSK